MSRAQLSIPVAVALLIASGSSGCRPDPGPLPCPPNCQADLDLTTRQYHLVDGDMQALRSAAWSLLLPFTSRGEGMPDPVVWIPSRSVLSAERMGASKQLPLKIERDQTETDVPLSDKFQSTFFNRTAQRFIESQALNVGSTTEKLQRAFAREITFPIGSMTLKAFWYRIRPGEELDVPIWDWTILQKHKGPTLESDPFKRQCVQVTPTKDGCIAAKEWFYTVTVEDPLSFCGRGCARPAVGDLMLLVGLHIVSKQTPEWLWATYWWRGPDTTTGTFWTCQDAQRPDAMKTGAKQWLNYSMTATAGFRGAAPTPKSAADEACGYPGDIDGSQQYLAVYNPFVEARFKPNGLKSSCVNCHARASTNNEVDQQEVPVRPTRAAPSCFPSKATYDSTMCGLSSGASTQRSGHHQNSERPSQRVTQILTSLSLSCLD